MSWQERISSDPAILTGKPIVAGKRVAVEQVLEQLAAGWTTTEMLDNYPTLDSDDILACLSYAAEILKSERIYPVPT